MEEPRHRLHWADLFCLTTLVLLAVALRAWQIAHTEVASRDSIGYIRIAWRLEQYDWRQVIPHSPQHPAYPLAVLALSGPVRHFLPDNLPLAWQLSAQLASALAGVLLIVPMYFLGREFFDRRIAFWACLLFQCLPSSGKVMGDGLSDSLFLLFACSGLWTAAVALRRGSSMAFALTGLAGGLAYLTRPEGVLIVSATGLVLLVLLLSRRLSWRSAMVHGSALALAALAVMSPYMILIRGITVKNTPNLMMHQQRKDADWEGRLRPQTHLHEIEKRSPKVTCGSSLFAIWWVPSNKEVVEAYAKDPVHPKPPPRYGWALKAMGLEMSKAFFYVAWLPALLGLWWFRDRFRAAAAWVPLLVCLILVGLLYRVAEKMGYLSDRHLLLVVLCASPWIVAAVGVLGDKMALAVSRLRPALAGSRWTSGRFWTLSLLLVLTVGPLARTLERLHSERAGFRAVGQWLAENTLAGDFIEDPYCWANFYAGRLFLEGSIGLPASQPSCYYVVLEQTKNKHPHLVSLGVAMLHALEGKEIHCHHVRRGKDTAEIRIYRVQGQYNWTPLPGLPGQSN